MGNVFRTAREFIILLMCVIYTIYNRISKYIYIALIIVLFIRTYIYVCGSAGSEKSTKKDCSLSYFNYANILRKILDFGLSENEWY